MSYDKLRYLEQLLSSIYSKGVDNHRKEIESYFEENYGEDSLVKPISIKENKITQDKVKTKTKLKIPDNLDEIMSRAVKRVFRG
jgi:hypothetical protein